MITLSGFNIWAYPIFMPFFAYSPFLHIRPSPVPEEHAQKLLLMRDCWWQIHLETSLISLLFFEDVFSEYTILG